MTRAVATLAEKLFLPPVFLLQMSEMEISRTVAERSLREHMGNVVEALVALTN